MKANLYPSFPTKSNYFFVIFCCCFLGLSLVFTQPIFAQIIITEDFEYGGTSGNLTGQNGGTGFATAWVNGTNAYTSTGLSFGGLSSPGGAMTVASGQSASRSITTGFSASGPISGSFLFKLNSAPIPSSVLMLGLGTAASSNNQNHYLGFMPANDGQSGLASLGIKGTGIQGMTNGNALSTSTTYLYAFSYDNGSTSAWILTLAQYNNFFDGTTLNQTAMNAASIGSASTNVTGKVTIATSASNLATMNNLFTYFFSNGSLTIDRIRLSGTAALGGLGSTAVTYTFNGTTDTNWATASNWSGGVVPTTATLNSGQAVVIASNCTMSGGSISFPSGTSFTINASTTFTMNATPTITIQSGATLNIDGTLAADNGTLNNAGTMTTASTGNFSNPNGSFTNSGTFNHSGTSTSTYGSFTNTGTINNSGTLIAGQYINVQNNGTFVNNSGGSVQFNGFINAANKTVTNNGTMSAGLDNSGTFTNNNTFSFNYLNVSNKSGGTITNSPGATMSLGLLPFSNAGTFNNEGAFSMTQGSGLASISNTASGIITNSGTFTVGSAVTATNLGTITTQASATFTNNGTVTGTGTFNSNGTYNGTGTFSSTLFTNPSGGTVAPGTSPGCLTYSNGYINSGTLTIELGGTTACTQYDKLNVTGTATLSGTLNVSLINSYTGSNGHQLTIISATSLSGTFSTVNLPSNWYINYNLPSVGQVTLSYNSPLVAGAALDFDGTDDYVGFPTTGMTSTAGTISFWMNAATSQTVGAPVIVELGTENVAIFLYDNGTKIFFRAGWTGNQFSVPFSGLGTWKHIAMTWEGDGQLIKGYVDGAFVGSFTMSGNASFGTTGYLGRSSLYSNGSTNFKGALDDIRFYNRALCAEEISQLKGCEVDALSANLQVYFKCNQGVAASNNTSLTTLTDDAILIGGANDGTLFSFSLNGSSSNFIGAGGVVTGTSCPTVVMPEIDVQGGAPLVSISDGTTSTSTTNNTDFGGALVNGPVVKTFTISNSTGASNLVVSSIGKSGTHQSEFTVGGASFPLTIAAGNTATFTITFVPTALGTRTATIEVNSNDCDEALYNFAVTGVGANAGAALHFDGSNDLITASGLLPTPPTQFTVEFWLKPESLSDYNQEISIGSASIGHWNGFTFHSTANGSVYVGTDIASRMTPADIPANTVVLNTWQHFAYVYNNGTGYFYKNGVLLYTKGNSAPPSFDVLRIGSGCCLPIKGALDELRIWNTARTCEQINQQRNCELTGTEANLVAYYPFNQGLENNDNSSTTTLNDLATTIGGANNGTLTGFALTGTTSNWIASGGVISGTNCPAVVAPEINVQGGSPLVSILNGSTSTATANHTDFGSVNTSSALGRTFTIQNTGNDVLTITNITSNNATFVVSNVPTTVAANSSATFTLTFTPTATGAQNATITVLNNDCDEANYTFNISGTGSCVAPSFSACPSNQTMTVASGSCTADYTIADPLSDNCSGATWGYTLSGATTRTISGIADGTSSGAISFNIGTTTVTVTGTDGTNSAVGCTFTVTVNAPEINIKGKDQDIPDGTTGTSVLNDTNFGTTSGAAITRTFTIQNTGTAPLVISAITSSNAKFTIGNLSSPSPLSSGISVTFTVTFSSNSATTQTAIISIINDDCNESTYDFEVSATSSSVNANALHFDGSDDLIEVPMPTPLFGTNSTTVEFWAKGAPNFSFPINFTGAGTTLVWGPTLALAVYGDNAYVTDYHIEDCWHHYAFTYNGATSTVYAYVDGQPTPTASFQGNFPAVSTDMWLGSRVGGYPWNGTMDELRIWNVQRTQAQIQANLFNELAGNESGLVAYYNFNQGTAGGDNTGNTSLLDAQTNGTARTGTMTGFALNGTTSNWVASGGLQHYPEIDIQGNTTSIVDGDTSPTDTDHTSFGDVFIGNSLVRTFTIKNTGTKELSISSIGSSNSLFTVGSLSSASPLAVNGSATFTVTFTPTAVGAQSATITVNNDDCNEAVYDFAVSGLSSCAATATISQTNSAICAGNNAIFTLMGTSGAVVTYNVNDGSNATTTLTGGTATVTISGVTTNQTLKLVSVNDGACTLNLSASATVTVKPLPTINVPATAICIGENLTLMPNNGGVWTSSDESKATVTSTGQVTTIASGNVKFIFTESVTGCSSTTPTITVNALPILVAGTATSPTTCARANGKIDFTTTNLPDGDYLLTYTGTGSPKTVNIVANGFTLTSLPAGEYSKFSITRSGCTGSDITSKTLTDPNPPTITLGAIPPICAGATSFTIPYTATTFSPVTYSVAGAGIVAETNQNLTPSLITVQLSAPASGTSISFTLAVKNGNQCISQPLMGAVVVRPLPTATIQGTTTVCLNAPMPTIQFTGTAATSPYTFSFRLNGNATQSITTSNGNSVSLNAATNQAGVFTYTLEKVSDAYCSQLQSGSATVTVLTKPTFTLTTQQVTLNEGNSQTFCDTDANPVNSLQFNVSGLCVAGTPVWRVQIGSGPWSSWSPNPPVTQSSNNQIHRYQAACDGNCPVTYTSPIEVTINSRASVPQNASLAVDGVTVAVGETKEVCSLVNTTILFAASCATDEIMLYSVDGGDYSAGVPVGLVDNQYHNYRVRCRKSNALPSCIESESGVMRLKLVLIPPAPTVSLSSTGSCNSTASFSGQSSCGSLKTVWYNATTHIALPSLPTTVPLETTSYYARCQTENGCVSEKSNVVTFTITSTHVAPIVTVSQELVCTGTTVIISANCPTGSTTFWNTGITTPSFEVSFSNVTKQSYWAKCIFEGGCQSAESIRKDIYWNAFVVTLINIGQTKSAVKTNDRSAWSSQFITRDGGPELEQSTQQNPTLYYVENTNKIAPRYWTINVDACALGTNGSLTFDMLATPEMGTIRSFNTHENNAPYFMYANRDGWAELYAQNHPAYGFFADNGNGGNKYDEGLPKGLYKLSIRYWDKKGWGSIYPATRQAQGSVLAYQEYWFRIQSKDGLGVGAARKESAPRTADGLDNEQRITDNSDFASVLPNPVTNTLRLKVQKSKGQVVQTTLRDASGRQIFSHSFQPESNTHQEEMDVTNLPNGLYFLNVQTEMEQVTLKVIKIN